MFPEPRRVETHKQANKYTNILPYKLNREKAGQVKTRRGRPR